MTGVCLLGSLNAFYTFVGALWGLYLYTFLWSASLMWFGEEILIELRMVSVVWLNHIGTLHGSYWSKMWLRGSLCTCLSGSSGDFYVAQ